MVMTALELAASAAQAHQRPSWGFSSRARGWRYWNLEPLVVDPATNTGMPVRYEPVTDVGADRVVNAVAAFELYGKPRQAPVIAIDFGTGTSELRRMPRHHFRHPVSADACSNAGEAEGVRRPSVIGHNGDVSGYLAIWRSEARCAVSRDAAVCTGGLAEVSRAIRHRS
jgi:pantothenate kinase type III